MITYFYSKPENIKKDTLKIPGEEKKHIVSVLRYKEGDSIDVVDGRGYVYKVEIADIKKNEIHCKIISKKSGENEPKIQLSLAQSLCKGYKMDWLIEKATEIGVSSVIPLLTERTIIKLGDSKKEKAKIDRWRKIAIASMKQSLRSFLPDIKPVTQLKKLLPEIRKYDLTLVGSLESDAENLRDLRQLKKSTKNILAIVGPEAGFTDEELNQLKSAGAIPVSLGRRRLKTETAGIVLSSLVLYELD
ncbi:MAG: 16S rRNA (uracil(1498)-N(3))-methyltransferase [Candidatus Zixiibacteriota bacterium]